MCVLTRPTSLIIDCNLSRPAAKRRNTANAVYHIESTAKPPEGAWMEPEDATEADASHVVDPTLGPYGTEALAAPTPAV
jgi:hypothetical protein